MTLISCLSISGLASIITSDTREIEDLPGKGLKILPDKEDKIIPLGKNLFVVTSGYYLPVNLVLTLFDPSKEWDLASVEAQIKGNMDDIQKTIISLESLVPNLYANVNFLSVNENEERILCWTYSEGKVHLKCIESVKDDIKGRISGPSDMILKEIRSHVADIPDDIFATGQIAALRLIEYMAEIQSIFHQKVPHLISEKLIFQVFYFDMVGKVQTISGEINLLNPQWRYKLSQKIFATSTD